MWRVISLAALGLLMPSCKLDPQPCEPIRTCDPERVAIDTGLAPEEVGVWAVTVEADSEQFGCRFELGCPEGAGGAGQSVGADTGGTVVTAAGAAGHRGGNAGAAADPASSGGAPPVPARYSCETAGMFPALYGRCVDGPLELIIDLQDRRIRLSFYATPEAINVSLFRDGRLLASGASEPEYKEVGDECEPCLLAGVTLTPSD